jgi:hypothetical protein
MSTPDPHATPSSQQAPACDVAAIRARWEDEQSNRDNVVKVYHARRMALEALRDVPALLSAYDQRGREIEQLTEDLDHERHEKETVADASQAVVKHLRAERDALRAEVAYLRNALADAQWTKEPR